VRTAIEKYESELHRTETLLQEIDLVFLKRLGISVYPESSIAFENRIFKRRLNEVTNNRLDPIANQPKRKIIEDAIKAGKYPTQSLKKL
jgi:hypothetical protein